jgi:hypothetical protein
MDRGFGKLKLVKALGLKNFKVLTIAATLGSEHPIVPSSAQETYLDKLRRYHQVTQYNSSDDDAEESEPVVNAVDTFQKNLSQWTISDDSNVLLGPEQKVCRNLEDASLIAVAIRDVFDKKIAQKVIRFFMYGFPAQYMPMVNKWLGLPKVVYKQTLSRLFVSDNPDAATNSAR